MVVTRSKRVATPPGGTASALDATVLVVDDSDLNRRLLKAILDRESVRVLEARDGREAVSLVRTECPDLVLLDIMMPGMDGYEVCRVLQADPDTASVPIIVLSALTEPADKVRALELGAVDYVTKPFDRGEVLARVHTQLRIQKLTASLRNANASLVAKQKSLDEDLRAAADIQASLIPRVLPDVRTMDVAWRFVPCISIGGDIFDVVRLDDDHVAVWLVDVSGHGVPAAMVTVSVCQSLSSNGGIMLDTDGRVRGPAEVVRMLDREYPIERFDKYFTMSYMVLQLSTGEVRYCNAAHPPPVLVRRDGSTELLEEGGTIVGMGDVIPYDEGCTRLHPGDRLYLYTDGIIEQTDRQRDDFGEERLHELLRSADGLSVEGVCHRVVSRLEDFSAGARPDDDVTLLGLEYRGPGHEPSADQTQDPPSNDKQPSIENPPSSDNPPSNYGSS